MNRNLRTFVRLFFLVLIFTLWLTEKISFWSVLLIAGLLTAPIWGRIYCGWVCPVFTTLDIIKPILKKPILNKYANFLENKVLKTLIFIIFLLTFFFTKKLDLSVPFFIMLIPIGLLITALFGTAKWHHMCPFGTIFSLPARFAKYGYTFTSQDCIKCGLCVKKCENSCLTFNKEKSLNIEKQHCLVCGKCRAACKENNISFDKLIKLKETNGKEQGGAAL